MTLTITQADIERGEREKTTTCPVIISGKRAFGRGVRVNPTRIAVGSTWYDLPRSAIDFIARFDAGLPVVPFSFEVGV